MTVRLCVVTCCCVLIGPFRVSEVTASATSMNEVLLEWSPPNGTAVQSYLVSWQYIRTNTGLQAARSSPNQKVVVPGSDTSTRIAVKLQGVHVKVSIQPLSEHGNLGEIITVQPRQQGNFGFSVLYIQLHCG